MSTAETPDRTAASPPTTDGLAFRQTSMIGSVICLLFAIVCLMSSPFEYGSQAVRPIVLIVTIFFGATLLSLVAFKIALKIQHSKKSLIWMIVLFALSFRAILIFSPPILEIDLYRYMWDGKVSNIGVSPFKFSPAQVLTADAQFVDAEFEQVAELANKTETLQTIVSRIHFEEYSTIYPPVSQWVFAVAMALVSDQASVEAHQFCLKTVLVAFDVGTIFCVFLLIKIVGQHPGWLIIYAWNPLVIKEIANSGHLDSIAVFFCTAALACVALQISSPKKSPSQKIGVRWIRKSALVVAGAILLALGTGAKLFPVLLLPAIVLAIFTRSWREAVLFGIVFSLFLTAVMWPMTSQNPHVQTWLAGRLSEPGQALVDPADEMGRLVKPFPEKKEGLTGFLTKWRMNDVLFSFIYYNAQPDAPNQLDRPWYVFVPNAARQSWHDRLAGADGLGGSPEYLTARIFTMSLYMVAYLAILSRLWISPEPATLLSSCFLLFAVFIILQPVQNPWYWLWAMPLVCFVHNRGWLFVSAIFFCYYLRFWFNSLEGEFWLGSFRYTGTGLFDHLIVWFEFGAIIALIVAFRFAGIGAGRKDVNITRG